jgi:CO dehydrogenase maturation factor
VSGDEGTELTRRARDFGLKVAGTIPHDLEITDYDLRGKPVFQLPGGSHALKTFYAILDSLNIP